MDELAELQALRVDLVSVRHSSPPLPFDDGSWLPFDNSSQKGGVFIHVDRGRFRLYLGDSWCILFYWLMMYLFLWDIYVRGRNYVFFISFIVSCFTWVIHDICILFFVLWNQEFILFLLVFSTHAFMCLLSITGIYRLIQSCCCLHWQLIDCS